MGGVAAHIPSAGAMSSREPGAGVRWHQAGTVRNAPIAALIMSTPKRNLRRVADHLRVPPLARQLSGDPLGLARAARSGRSERLIARTHHADRVVQSICPFCAVGCGQKLYVKDDELIQIEGDPDSPVSRGRLCPKGSASLGLVKSPTREYRVKYRRPHGRHWEELPLDRAMDMIADRVIATRERTWQSTEPAADGEPPRTLNRTLGFASLGGATLDNEENYLMKKFFSALGAVQIENQARI